MKREYTTKLKLANKLLHDSYAAKSEEKRKKEFWRGHDLMEELILTKDDDVLCGLFDFFTNENENGVCETLESGIYQHFEMYQLLKALYKKFNLLAERNQMRAVHFARAFINVGMFDDFRKMFNAVKMRNPFVFLDNLKYKDKYDKEISILQEDVKGWYSPSERGR
jgi:hypothetical protein